tara:strand:+ start:390 stop:944 length:555 start_codon:yes stop_codon:yes gene_type:complete
MNPYKENIRIIKTGIDPKPFLDQMDSDHWNWVSRQKNLGGKKNPYGFLPLVWAKVPPGIDPHEHSGKEPTGLYDHYTEIHKFWKKYKIKKTGRAAFFKLAPGRKVLEHIDRGDYYKNKDRYHLSLQGKYRYRVGDEEMIVEPGTFFWFYNKIPHSAENVGDVDRITFVWDVPHHKSNPHHKIGF